jgi:cysteine synthase
LLCLVLACVCAFAHASSKVNKAKELSAKHGWFWTRQFENEANPAFHAQTTGAEILSDFAQRDLHYYVTGYGTGGTFQGVGRVLKAARPEVKIVVGLMCVCCCGLETHILSQRSPSPPPPRS